MMTGGPIRPPDSGSGSHSGKRTVTMPVQRILRGAHRDEFPQQLGVTLVAMPGATSATMKGGHRWVFAPFEYLLGTQCP